MRHKRIKTWFLTTYKGNPVKKGTNILTYFRKKDAEANRDFYRLRNFPYKVMQGVITI